MKIERSCRYSRYENPAGLRRIVCSLFLVAAVVAAVGAVASSRANQGSMRLSNALPANIIVVTNTNDSGPGSLRDALAVANDGDTIDATGVSGTILLTSGQLNVDKDVTISGPGAESSGSRRPRAKSRVLRHAGKTVTIDGLTIANGYSDYGAGGIHSASCCADREQLHYQRQLWRRDLQTMRVR